MRSHHFFHGTRGWMLLFAALFIANGAMAKKRYLVTIDSPVTYQALKNSQQGNKNPKSFAFRLLDGSGVKVEKFLDRVQMAVVSSQKSIEIEKLKGQGGIVHIEEEFFIPSPRPFLERIGALNLLYLSEKVDRPWGIDMVRAPEAWERGISGRDTRILILDTGIDQNHPDLASRFEKGKNFSQVDLPDAPYDYFDDVSHGTHVAGTIAADGKVSGLIGVAPEAKILAGRVCSIQGCSSISIIEGVNWGIEEKVDVMNLSLGGPFPSLSGERAYQLAHDAGIVVVCAAGNDGLNKVSFPGVYPSTIAVGAIDAAQVKAEFSNWGPELDIVAPGVGVLSSVPRGKGRLSELKVNLMDEKGWVAVESSPVQGTSGQSAPLEKELVAVGLGKIENYASLDLKEKIVLVERGEITFYDKVKNALDQGALGVIIYNNEPGALTASLGDGVSLALPAVFISQDLGRKILEKIGHSSIFVSLYSRESDFEKMDGTSMASPHVTGVVGLIKSANKQLSPDQIKEIITQTARPLSPNNENQYGAGLIDAFAAVNKALELKLLPAIATGS